MRARKNWKFAAIFVAVVAVSALGGVSTRGSEAVLEAPGLESAGGNGRMINGTKVDKSAHAQRWQGLVALLDVRNGGSQHQNFFCAGALVSPTKVVTAANCINGTLTEVRQISSPSDIRVLIGTEFLDDALDSREKKRVTKIVLHPAWTGDQTAGNDVAVLTLETASAKTPIKVVGSGEDNVWGNGNGVAPDSMRGPWVAGWGATSGTETAVSAYPYELNIPIWSDVTCSDEWATAGVRYNAAKLLCAGQPAGTALPQGACMGDSGSPLIAGNGDVGTRRLVGLVSVGFDRQGESCGMALTDGYTRIAGVRGFLANQGVPISTSNVAQTFPTPGKPIPATTGGATTGGGTTGGGSAGGSTAAGGAGGGPGGTTATTAPPAGPAATLTAPADRFEIAKLGGVTDLAWTVRSDVRAGRLVIKSGGRLVFEGAAAGRVGLGLNNAALRAGTYAWCLSTVSAATGAPVSNDCRTFTRRAAHAAALTRATWRGTKGSFRGEVVSTAAAVTVKVKVQAEGKTVASGTARVRPAANGRPTKFAFSSAVPSGLRARSLTALVTVTGGGVTKTFRSVLR